MFSDQQINRSWNEIKMKILKTWTKLSEADLEKTKTNLGEIRKLIELTYGGSEEFDATIDQILSESIYKTFGKKTLDEKVIATTDDIKKIHVPFFTKRTSVKEEVILLQTTHHTLPFIRP